MRVETVVEEGVTILESLQKLLEAAGEAAVFTEGLQGQYMVGFTLTDNVKIQAVNAEQRGIDRATDVLSFPSVSYAGGGTARMHGNRLKQEYDPDTRCIYLGDIIISQEKAAEQAAAYGHSVYRELVFLFVHGMLHLMGYDHETDADRIQMRNMEELIMEKTGVNRTLSDGDIALIEGAKAAMKMAYAPYSKYKVGACVRTSDGKLYNGCNVENASYGLTLCAERNAMTTAVTEGMHAIEAIAIAAEGTMPYPCGACRQFMREFAKDMKVILVSGDKIEVSSLQALLPDSFGPESIEEVNA